MRLEVTVVRSRIYEQLVTSHNKIHLPLVLVDSGKYDD